MANRVWGLVASNILQPGKPIKVRFLVVSRGLDFLALLCLGRCTCPKRSLIMSRNIYDQEWHLMPAKLCSIQHEVSFLTVNRKLQTIQITSSMPTDFFLASDSEEMGRQQRSVSNARRDHRISRSLFGFVSSSRPVAEPCFIIRTNTGASCVWW